MQYSLERFSVILDARLINLSTMEGLNIYLEASFIIVGAYYTEKLLHSITFGGEKWKISKYMHESIINLYNQGLPILKVPTYGGQFSHCPFNSYPCRSV